MSASSFDFVKHLGFAAARWPRGGVRRQGANEEEFAVIGMGDPGVGITLGLSDQNVAVWAFEVVGLLESCQEFLLAFLPSGAVVTHARPGRRIESGKRRAFEQSERPLGSLANPELVASLISGHLVALISWLTAELLRLLLSFLILFDFEGFVIQQLMFSIKLVSHDEPGLLGRIVVVVFGVDFAIIAPLVLVQMKMDAFTSRAIVGGVGGAVQGVDAVGLLSVPAMNVTVAFLKMDEIIGE